MSEHALSAETVERLVELLGQRSSVKIETNSKGLAQVKVSVYAHETEAEMERVRLLALKTYDETQTALGRRAQFS